MKIIACCLLLAAMSTQAQEKPPEVVCSEGVFYLVYPNKIIKITGVACVKTIDA